MLFSTKAEYGIRLMVAQRLVVEMGDGVVVEALFGMLSRHC